MRTAIFGGTFDPIHSAHLVVAREAAETFSLDRVLFIPAANPPLKEAGASFEDRYRMVELACAADPRFIPSRLEAGAEKSYSIHTIERVRPPRRARCSSSSARMRLPRFEAGIAGEDVIASVDFIVVARPGHDYTCPPGRARSSPGNRRAARLFLRNPPCARARRDPRRSSASRRELHPRARPIRRGLTVFYISACYNL